MLLRWHVNGFQFVHGSHPSQLECVILVGLAFDVGPLPSIFVCRTDECGEVVALGQIVDPAGRSAGLHDDEVDFVLFEDRVQVIPLGRCVQECVFPSFSVKKAAHGIEFAEIKSENFHWMFLGNGVGIL